MNADGTYNLSNAVWLGNTSPIGVTEIPTPISTGGTIQGGNIKGFDLYINHVFTLNEIHKIITNRISYYLIRLHRIQRNTLHQASNEV